MKKSLISFILLIISITSIAGDTIITPPNQFLHDPGKNLIVVNYDVDLINNTWINNKTSIVLDDAYNFVVPVHKVDHGIGYLVENSNTNIISLLYFTQLPLVSVTTQNVIVDEPRVFAQFSLVESDQTELKSKVGIEYRGGSTLALDKKSYRIEFWEDSTGSITNDVSLLGMRLDDDWNLQAMANEPLRVRSKTNNELWKLIHQIYYQSTEPLATNGIKMEYVELFVNNEYKGIYCLGERIDRKQLQLKKNDSLGMRGELYKGVAWGGSTYTTVIPYDNNFNYWNGFEFKYPQDFLDWNNIYQFVDFVVNETDDQFYTHYQKHFNLSSAVDYFIFLNLLRATDNTGKNVYVARYNKNSPYYFVPWDLDGTLGMIWDGTMVDITNDILFNGFFERVWNDCNKNGFRDKLYWKWNLLRQNVITQSGIMSMIASNIDLLKNNGIYERESIAWSDYEYDSGELSYLDQWLYKRLQFLDLRFTKCVESDPPLISGIYPNPATDYIKVKLSDRYLGVNLIITDLTGKTVLNERIDSGINTISVSDLSSGIYFVRVNDHAQQTYKLIVAK